MSTPIRFALWFGLLAVAACHPERNIDPDAPLRLEGDSGVVVGAVEAPAVDHYHRRASFWLRRVGGGPKVRLDSAVPRPLPLRAESAPDAGLERTSGLLFACELPAGEYEVHEVQLIGSPVIVLRPSEPPRFEVRAGEVAYLGALHVEFLVGPVTSMRHAIRSGTPSFRDEAARDLPLLRARFPVLARREIVSRVIDAAGVSWARD